MPLIRLARNVQCLTSLVILTAVAVPTAAQTRESATPVLDLTKPVPREEQLTALPGGEGGGGAYFRRSYALPLAVELQSISPQPVMAGEKFIVEVLLRNTGVSAFYLPASRNSVKVLKQGNKGRRTFLFFLVFEDPNSGKEMSHIMASTQGSDTVAPSRLRLDPGQFVRVLLKGDLYPFADWLKPELKQVRVRAKVSEWKYEDKRYFIESTAEPVISGNTVLLDLAPAN